MGGWAVPCLALGTGPVLTYFIKLESGTGPALMGTAGSGLVRSCSGRSGRFLVLLHTPNYGWVL